ncbi:DUF262 domain-containing protein [Nocardioides iriomotensis]|uniref:DUF262 domain-containing protein n=1 Tax=Nocardioides iriomotensis TaxID=715784 RepID=A0A4Q5IUQ0_9ACTN|nr:DUF262 domain-containing protein [Nocardioides iriomotensis]RYU09677.1 DUF262 domain-containing protein [Nocardioides iriomotensis]
MSEGEDWVASDEIDDLDEATPTEFDILSSPNDWNVLTIGNYMEAGAIQIPYFQRNYVWDIKRASRLIESLLVGLPVPQIFLYEEERNRYLVIDGQQRLLTIYFYLKGRFPRPSRRGHLRALLRNGPLDEAALADDSAFQDFALNLSTPESQSVNRFHKLKYTQLDTYKPTLDLRALRNVVVKQVSPRGNDAMYEIFNRLNSGGVNLAPQEIRASLYRSELMSLIDEINHDSSWRKLIGRQEPDSRMQDAEILLRSVALAMKSDIYSSPMTTFINSFCVAARGWPQDRAADVEKRLRHVIEQCHQAGPEAFRRSGRFSPLLFEAVVATLWANSRASVTYEQVIQLAADERFVNSLQEGSTKTVNVRARLRAAAEHVG